jgi:2,4-dienoyl-CoA reductase-like NADH-dependent reductase (Old Yellow Enzyme family)
MANQRIGAYNNDDAESAKLPLEVVKALQKALGKSIILIKCQ